MEAVRRISSWPPPGMLLPRKSSDSERPPTLPMAPASEPRSCASADEVRISEKGTAAAAMPSFTSVLLLSPSKESILIFPFELRVERGCIGSQGDHVVFG